MKHLLMPLWILAAAAGLFVTTPIFAATSEEAPQIACVDEHADFGTILPPCTKCGNCQLNDFLQLFVRLYGLALELLAPVALLFLIVGGITLLTASGVAARVQLGQTIIRNAIYGTIIILVSWTIVDTTIYVITGDSETTIFSQPWYTFRYSCSDRIVLGCTSSGVAQIQTMLAGLGYTVGSDKGYFDEVTRQAAQRFQVDANRIMREDAVDSCSLDLWNEVFEHGCQPEQAIVRAEGICSVPAQAVADQTLTTDGTPDTKTTSLLQLVSLTPSAFSTCKTSS